MQDRGILVRLDFYRYAGRIMVQPRFGFHKIKFSVNAGFLNQKYFRTVRKQRFYGSAASCLNTPVKIAFFVYITIFADNLSFISLINCIFAPLLQRNFAAGSRVDCLQPFKNCLIIV